ncbi:MAG: hypothetical protein ACOCV8_05730 [Spirochaetota bacterium]
MSFRPIDINILLERFIEGIKNYNDVYNIPQNKIFKGNPDYDLSVIFHNRKASSPLGPAAGPHTQLAQNIVNSWLAGSRIIELKTIQINDKLDIPRPCIDVPNIGFNVEFSQELSLDESLREYVKAHMIIEIIKKLNIIDIDETYTDTIFEMSAGYDFKGISTNKIRNYINHLKDAFLIIEEIKKEFNDRNEKYKEINIDSNIINSITLSTFHGCPPDEIQEICEFLIEEMGLNVTVKMNPTLLGKERLEHILYKQLGYHHIHVNDTAYKNDIGFDRAVNMMKTLNKKAKDRELSAGVKFLNTLEVINNRNVFSDKVMFMSGEPLYLFALNLVKDFRDSLSGSEYEDMTVSFSAGISKHNFPEAVSLGLVPITVCTDLLRPKGYSKLKSYYDILYKSMDEVSAKNIKDYIIKKYDNDTDKLEIAIKNNTEKYLKKLKKNPYFYSYENNSKFPNKKILSLISSIVQVAVIVFMFVPMVLISFIQ